MNTAEITLTAFDLESMLVRAAKLGAEAALEEMATYNYAEAAKRIGISQPTLRLRIRSGKINPVDGRITESEIRRYLSIA